MIFLSRLLFFLDNHDLLTIYSIGLLPIETVSSMIFLDFNDFFRFNCCVFVFWMTNTVV